MHVGADRLIRGTGENGRHGSISLQWRALDVREDLPADRRPPASQSGSVTEVGRKLFVSVVRIIFHALGIMRDSLFHSHTDLMLVVRSKDFLLTFLSNIHPSFAAAQHRFLPACK